MTTREHITTDNFDQAATPRRHVEQTGYVSPTVRRWAEARQAAATEVAADRYRVPETREQLIAMKSADQTRTYLEHREMYDQLMNPT